MTPHLVPMMFGTEKLMEWLLKQIMPPLLLVMGITIIVLARKGRLQDAAVVLVGTVLGCLVIFGYPWISSLATRISDLLAAS